MTGAFDLTNFYKVKDKCSECGQAFHLEPSFYYGAMYVSYGLQVALFVAVAIAIWVFLPNAGVITYMVGVGIIAVVLLPINLRLSRSIWIHFFVKYDPSKLPQ